MASRNPQLLFDHAFRTAGASALGGSAFDAAFPRERVIDSGGSRLARFSGTGGHQYVKANRGAGFASLPTPDRLIIPAGHNLDGCVIQVRSHTADPGSGLTGTLLGTVAITGSDLVDLALSPAISTQWALVNFVTSGTQWEFGELWLGELRSFTTASPSTDWDETRFPRIVATTLESGLTYRAAKGQTRRGWELQYPWVDSTDLAIFDELATETADGLFPFYFYDFDDTHAPVLVDLQGDVKRTQDHAVPLTAKTYTIPLTLIESLA